MQQAITIAMKIAEILIWEFKNQKKIYDKMTKLYLVRHGKCDWNGIKVLGNENRNITRGGIEDCYLIAEELRSKTIDRVYCSPLERAKLSAGVIIAFTNPYLKLEVINEFAERSHGIMQGEEREGIEKRFPEYYSVVNSYDKRFPGGESLKEVEPRVKPKLTMIIEQNLGKNILIVSHNDVMRVMRKILLEKSEEDAAKTNFERGKVYEYELKDKFIIYDESGAIGEVR